MTFPDPDDVAKIEKELIRLSAESDQDQCHDRDSVLYGCELMSRSVKENWPKVLQHNLTLLLIQRLATFAKWLS